MEMATRFNPLLVTTSVLVAIFASYVAMNLASSMTQTKRRLYETLWLVTGAIAMGSGIWSMHFIGMLAFEMPGMQMAYDLPMMALSIFVAIAASGLAFLIVSRKQVPVVSLVSGGIAMAAAIAGMHYIGMYSMRMQATIHWNIFLVTLSVIIALGASFAALYILTRFRSETQKQAEIMVSAVVMGIAISGMHYTGMYAATFVHSDAIKVDDTSLLVSSGLTFGVVATTLLILGLALISSLSQKIMDRRMKSATKSLVTTEEKFRLLVDAVKDYAILMLDTEGHITTWNAGAQRISGYSADEVIGKHFSMFYTQDDIDNETAEWELRIARETGHFEGEGKRLRKDRTWYWASIVLAPLYDDVGEHYGYSKVIRDITQFVESEKRMRQLNEDLENRVKIRTQALKEREAQLRNITNALPVLIAQVDAHEKILFSNEGFRHWFNQDESIVGKTFQDVLGSERYYETQDFVKKVMAGEMVMYERNSVRDGDNVCLSVTYVPELGENNKVNGFLVLASDVSKYKEIQSELEHAKEAAEVANATKSSFLANMSHEIRTPLGAVLGFSDLLIDPQVSISEKVNYVAVIKRNGELLSNIINDILDLSKVEAGKMQLSFTDVELKEVVNDTKSLLELQAKDKGIDLVVEIDDNVPDVIRTDQLRLRQILINIIGNAIKFTSRGEVSLKIKCVDSDERKDSLWFTVKDSGIGIRPDQVGKLFAPFSQADVTSKRKYGGTGLGLALSKRLAALLGGDLILAESVPDKGSTFVISIDPGTVQNKIKEPNKAKQPLPAIETLDGIKILLAEDSPDNQLLASRFLRLAGAAVDVVNNGREAIDRLNQKSYDVVLMDLQMPIMDGYEATESLRKKGFKGKILALTAHASNEEREHCLRSGFDGHIKKPIDRNILIDQVNYFSKQSEVL
jgi:PAS domain S-box-containing protein